MRWSQAKKRFEALLAPSLHKRLQVHVTEYSKSSFDVGRGWITLDGEQVVSVQIPSFYDQRFNFSTRTLNFGEAIRAYLNLSIEDAAASDDALVRGFALLDRRFGKRKLRGVDGTTLDDFSKLIYDLRCAAEGIDPLAARRAISRARDHNDMSACTAED